ncbi:MAG: GDP-mannose 4,6-dehydratase [Deltaproteobacteria bacterium]|nr:GDP-mannose 4,6-dehydratase [Deltaproteobacteria bacterium]
MKRALITGIAGQDGSYLAEFLLAKGYDVFGLVLRDEPLRWIDPIKDRLILMEGDLRNQKSLDHAVRQALPDEVYHLGALPFVAISWKQPVLTADVNALGTTRLLEALRSITPHARIYHASTSEMFGLTEEIQTEEGLFHPRNPYSISKCYSHWIAVNYRESYDMYVCCGIMFNHESPRRGENFVTRKIARGVVDIKEGKQDCLYLGNLDVWRDWGYASEYVEVMWLMLQQDAPDDYIISTGEVHTVREFLEEAFCVVGLDAERNGKKGIEEAYIRKDNGQAVVRISPEFFRPVELTVLRGSNSKAKGKLKWEPKTRFRELVRIMVDYEMQNTRPTQSIREVKRR